MSLWTISALKLTSSSGSSTRKTLSSNPGPVIEIKDSMDSKRKQTRLSDYTHGSHKSKSAPEEVPRSPQPDSELSSGSGSDSIFECIPGEGSSNKSQNDPVIIDPSCKLPSMGKATDNQIYSDDIKDCTTPEHKKKPNLDAIFSEETAATLQERKILLENVETPNFHSRRELVRSGSTNNPILLEEDTVIEISNSKKE